MYHLHTPFQARTRWLGWLAVPVVVLVAAGCGSAATPTPEGCSPANQRGTLPESYDSPPALTIDPANQYVATLETERGNIVVELFAADAPNTVNNFVFLAREGFYDNSTFHRVIPGFMAQGGDPTGTGSGGPGYRFDDEFSPNLRHDGPGVLSMAKSPAPSTNGSQFFITYVATPHLDDLHSVFGRVTEGRDVLEKLTPRDPLQSPSYQGDTLRCITIVESTA